jgi:hypothetical protein
MSDQPEKPDKDLNITAGDDVTVGGDVVGGDKTTTTTTHVGFSATQVQRLLITVGALVFLTAACFFSGGLAVGFVAFNALNTPVGSSQAAAQRFEVSLDRIQDLAPGQPFEFRFSDEELSSWVKFVAGPQIGFATETGRARILSADTVMIHGQLASAGNLPVIATLKFTSDPARPIQIVSAAAKFLRVGEPTDSFGYVAVPPGFLADAEQRINQLIGGVQVSRTTDISAAVGAPALSVEGVRR